MNSWKVILATMVIFGAGVVTGGLVVRRAVGPAARHAGFRAVAVTNQPALSAPPGQLQRMEFLLRARKELALTPRQHERIEEIIREGQERSRRIWERVAPDLRKELQTIHEEIRAELTPEQRRRFEQLLRNSPRGTPPPQAGPAERMRKARPENHPPDGDELPPRSDRPMAPSAAEPPESQPAPAP